MMIFEKLSSSFPTLLLWRVTNLKSVFSASQRHLRGVGREASQGDRKGHSGSEWSDSRDRHCTGQTSRFCSECRLGAVHQHKLPLSGTGHSHRRLSSPPLEAHPFATYFNSTDHTILQLTPLAIMHQPILTDRVNLIFHLSSWYPQQHSVLICWIFPREWETFS